MLNRAFCSRDIRLWRHLYVSLVRPHLEFAVNLYLDIQAWNPYLEKDIMKIGKVKIRASNIPYVFCILSYGERLKILKINSLNDRRVMGDLIEAFKVLRGLDEIGRTSHIVQHETGFKSPILRTDIELKRPA